MDWRNGNELMAVITGEVTSEDYRSEVAELGDNRRVLRLGVPQGGPASLWMTQLGKPRATSDYS